MNEASKIVSETLLASIPPGSPSMFREILTVKHEGRGRKAKIDASLILFDGGAATVRLEPFQWGWSIQWTSLPDGPFMLNGDAWERCTEPGIAQGEAA